ncbi:MAG: hypothetical protein LBF41_03715 [Deltaproteobacteria bacterium]|nr:hypothetical protein [Deltaproteobacteria bacterium]
MESPPVFPERKLLLVFERESDFAPLANREVVVRVSAPAKVLIPAGGTAVTDENGAVEVVYGPVSRYDENALKAGDLIIDYPATLWLSMDLNEYETFEWEVDDSLSFARYADPLYRGLNREPDGEPAYLNLFLP